MYSSLPKRDRIAIRTSLTAAWLFAALSGAGGLFLTPTTVQSEIGTDLPLISNGIILAFSLSALFGVIFNKYQAEWVAAWFTAGGSFVYIIVVWYLVFTSAPTRLQQAASLTALMFFYIYRIVACAAHARKQRRIHELVQSGGISMPNA